MISDTDARPLRLAVVGARRRTQGTGPFLALQAAANGGQVVGLWGTSAASAEDARLWLAERGLATAAFADWNRLLAETQPEALIIAGPRETHAAWLDSGLRARLHVLCEKPLMASRPAAHLARDFAAAGLILRENCQWPRTLPFFRALHPEVNLARVSRFRMTMTPSHDGRERWQELLSHPLSLLQALAPGPVELEQIRFHDAGRLTLLWRSHKRVIECEVRAVPSDEYPRPAEYRLDDALLRRRIEQPGYRFSFEDQTRRVIPGEDPMELEVRAFVAQATRARERGAAAVNEDLVRRQELFDRILRTWPA